MLERSQQRKGKWWRQGSFLPKLLLKKKCIWLVTSHLLLPAHQPRLPWARSGLRRDNLGRNSWKSNLSQDWRRGPGNFGACVGWLPVWSITGGSTVMAVGGRVDTITHNETATSAAQDVVHLPTIHKYIQWHRLHQHYYPQWQCPGYSSPSTYIHCHYFHQFLNFSF